MPQLSPEVIHLRPGQAIIIDVPYQAELIPTIDARRQAVLDQISTHFVSHIEFIGFGRSNNFDDLEELRSELAPGFERIIPDIEELQLTDREMVKAIRKTLETNRNIDPFLLDATVKTFAHTYIQELRSFQQSITHHRAA